MQLLGVLVVGIISSLVLKAGGEELTSFAQCDIPAIYNFGDSNSDTGGSAAALFPLGPPNGETFFHRPAGRVSDGRLIIDFIVERLGLPYLSAYLDSIGTNFRQGANFATVGATIRRQNGSWLETYFSPFPLDIQVRHYDQFKARSTYFYNKAREPSERSKLPRPADFSKALYTIDIGQNDLGDCFQIKSREQIQATISNIVNQLTDSVQQLYQRGARAFWIHNTGPIGCLPSSILNIQNPMPGYFDEHGCIKDQNDIAEEFNKQLKHRVIELRAELPQAALTYVDIYTAKYNLIIHAETEGFENPFKICHGYQEKDISVWCGEKATISGTEAGFCKDPSTVISWDGTHYSEAANHWIANHIIDGSLSDPPIPITQACHSQGSEDQILSASK